jgi:DNA-binding MarR family transcriptional regulator
VLTFLAGRAEVGLRVKEIAAHLGVSQPTATDSIVALERKGFVGKAPDTKDARAVAVRVTNEGMTVVNTLGPTTSAIEIALANLSESEQTELLLLQIKLIRLLQLSGAIPVQRMCVTCSYFRPNAYSDVRNPHHCAFVNAAFGDRDLRVDCHEHETAESAVQATTWRTFTKGASAPLQANSKTRRNI